LNFPKNRFPKKSTSLLLKTGFLDYFTAEAEKALWCRFPLATEYALDKG
jgi:hypothetical protein